MDRRHLLKTMLATSALAALPAAAQAAILDEVKTLDIKIGPEYWRGFENSGFQFDFLTARWQDIGNGWWRGACEQGEYTFSAYFKFKDGPPKLDPGKGLRLDQGDEVEMWAQQVTKGAPPWPHSEPVTNHALWSNWGLRRIGHG
jgi:TAT (twin-arginine translocation) pathway signal sequence